MYSDELEILLPGIATQRNAHMYPLNRILVALDNTDMDDELVEYASFAAQTSNAETVYFVNIIKDAKIPDDVLAEFPQLLENAIKDRVKALREKIEQHFDLSLKAEIKFIVKQGQPAKQLLDLANQYNIDALLIGRKKSKNSSHVVAQRLARRATCSLLIVPETKYTTMKKLMVATDFSDTSLIALEEAIAIASQNKEEAEILCHHVFSVPSGYYYTGKSYKEFSEIMKKNALKDFNKYIQQVDTKGVNIKPILTLDKNDNPVDDIYRVAMKEKVDCILVGGKGKSATTSLFVIGNTTEKLVSNVAGVPLLLVRPKDQDESIMDYIRKI